MSVDRCVCCGEIVPESLHICTSCSENVNELPMLENCGSCKFYTNDGWCELFFIKTLKDFRCRYDYEAKEKNDE